MDFSKTLFMFVLQMMRYNQFLDDCKDTKSRVAIVQFYGGIIFYKKKELDEYSTLFNRLCVLASNSLY